jgi:hypothetical protein
MIRNTFIVLLIAMEHVKLFLTTLSTSNVYHDQLLLKRHIHCIGIITGKLLLPSWRKTAKFKAFKSVTDGLTQTTEFSFSFSDFRKGYLIFIIELYSRASFTCNGKDLLQTRLLSRCLAMTASINSTITAFSHNVTIRCNPYLGILVLSQDMLKNNRSVKTV